jgi:uncharacterized protein involved in exopolysaccharide biosynthesis
MSQQGLRSAFPSSMSTPLPGLGAAEANHHVLLTIFKWDRLILCFGAVLMVAAGVAMLMKPEVPVATARILINSGEDAGSISGLRAGGRTPSPEVLQSEAELLTSRVVLLPVARALSAERGGPASDAELEAGVAELRGNVVVTPVPGTTVLQARKSAPDPVEAERVLGMILDSYVERHAGASGGPASLTTFFEHETERAAAGLKEAENRLRRWQEANNVVSMEDQLGTQLAIVGELNAGIQRTDGDIEATRAQISALTRDMAALPAQSVTGREHVQNPLVTQLKAELALEEARLTDVGRGPVIERLRTEITAAELALRDASASPLVSKLKGDLVTAELALNDLRQRYLDQDRRVQEKLEQIERLKAGIATAEAEAEATARERLQNLRDALAAAERDVAAAAQKRIAGLRAQLAAAEREGDIVGRQIMAPTPLREAVNRDLVGARARLTSLTSLRDSLRDQLQGAKIALGNLQEKRVDVDRLAREIELAKAAYLQSNRRLDDARVTAGLRKQQLTNIAVIEPPRATESGGGRKNVVLISMLGGVVGLGLGVAMALALEFFNWSLRTPEDVEFYLGVPALAAIPALPAAPRRPRALPAAFRRTSASRAASQTTQGDEKP